MLNKNLENGTKHGQLPSIKIKRTATQNRVAVLFILGGVKLCFVANLTNVSIIPHNSRFFIQLLLVIVFDIPREFFHICP